MPPPAEGFAARLVLGPALRTQPDRRLVTLVREGYESAFEEIVRRYGKALTRYAAAIVGSRGEDVTQDAFSKALLALRRNDTEIELRPWLFRIVRNTALNDLRDSPPTPELLAEAIAGGESPAEVQERREELTDLMQRLRSLPETQRAAIVMREMEGLSHEEIATALGVSGGAARQAIHRARRTLRDGAGMLLPLPLLKVLLAAGSMGSAEVAAGAGGAVGTGVALKAVTASVLVVGAVGAGVAIQSGGQAGDRQQPPAAVHSAPREEALVAPAPTAPVVRTSDDHSGSGRGGGGDRGRGESGDDRGHGGSEQGEDRSGHRGWSRDDDGGSGGPGSGDDHESTSTTEPDDRHGGSGPGGGGDDHSGSSGPGPSASGSGHSNESSGHGGGPGPSGSSGGDLSNDLASDSGGDGGGSSGGPGPSEAQAPVETSGGSEGSGGGGGGSSDGSGSGGTSGSGDLSGG